MPLCSTRTMGSLFMWRQRVRISEAIRSTAAHLIRGGAATFVTRC